VLLIGEDRALSYFHENAKDDPNFVLLMVAKTRVGLINRAAAASLKAMLLRKGWRPDYFRSPKE
jgi:general stress protein 26